MIEFYESYNLNDLRYQKQCEEFSILNEYKHDKYSLIARKKTIQELDWHIMQLNTAEKDPKILKQYKKANLDKYYQEAEQYYENVEKQLQKDLNKIQQTEKRVDQAMDQEKYESLVKRLNNQEQ
ncbi:hypothetical protein OXYTRIMIC_589 [Oxytricha trifallax]|uniref:Uncharacterized protein n=1 Tax=Oxytricha trifallax TaxID=1172189 RepID=A0A073HYN7_9SPIT|nr:hypothetical protein OXYTRIMIC_589 [Oxytricha trifallax]